MKERHIRILTIFVVAAGLVFNFQNCGSNSQNLDGAAKAVTTEDDGDMDIIDPNITGSIRFAQTKVQMSAADTELRASGVCSAEQTGALLNWKVYDEGDQVIASGKALCDAGLFEVVIAGAQDLICGAELRLEASLGSKARSQLLINKNCL